MFCLYMYVCSYVTQQGRSVTNCKIIHLTDVGPAISPTVSRNVAVWQVLLPAARHPTKMPVPNFTAMQKLHSVILSSLLQLPTGTGSGLACHHVLSRSRLVPLTKLCASIAPRKYTCIRTPTWRGSDLFPGSSQRSYRQGAIRVFSSSGPRLEELLSFGQALRRNTGGYSLNIQHVHVNVSTLCF